MTTRSLSPEFALLGLLEQRPAHGYELHQRLYAELGYLWHISLSQAYNILKRLEAQGFIQGAPQPQENLPDLGDLSDSALQARYPDIPTYMGANPPYMGLGIKRESPNHY